MKPLYCKRCETRLHLTIYTFCDRDHELLAPYPPSIFSLPASSSSPKTQCLILRAPVPMCFENQFPTKVNTEPDHPCLRCCRSTGCGATWNSWNIFYKDEKHSYSEESITMIKKSWSTLISLVQPEYLISYRSTHDPGAVHWKKINIVLIPVCDTGKI